jgi:sugar phosphate permease
MSLCENAAPIARSMKTEIQSEHGLYRKVTARLIPFLFLCYILSYVDRVNVGFAKLQMQQDLGMSDTVFGAGMGIFFIGYFLFETIRVRELTLKPVMKEILQSSPFSHWGINE